MINSDYSLVRMFVPTLMTTIRSMTKRKRNISESSKPHCINYRIIYGIWRRRHDGETYGAGNNVARMTWRISSMARSSSSIS